MDLGKLADLIKLIMGSRVLAFALSFGGWLLLWLARDDPTVLSGAPWLKSAIYVLAVPVSIYFGVLILVDLIKTARTKITERRKRDQSEAQVLARWDQLDLRQRQVLAAMFVTNRREVFAHVETLTLRTLRNRGFLQNGPGQHLFEDWCWQIPPFVWRELERRRAELGAMDAPLNMDRPWEHD